MSGAERAYRLWQELIADEELFEATLARRHRELAGSRDLSPDDLALLDELAEQPGTRWNIENLRFRCAGHVGGMLQMYLPVTVAILTENREMWLQDIAFEYLAYHRWRALGTELAEVERFVDYARRRIARRRLVPEYLDAVLSYEAAVVALRKMTRDIPAEIEPPPAELDALVAVRGPAVVTARLPFALEFLEELKKNPEAFGHVSSGREIPGDPVELLGFVTSRAEPPRFIRLAEPVAAALDACDGRRRIAEVIDRLGADLEIEPDDALALIRQLFERRILVAAAS